MGEHIQEGRPTDEDGSCKGGQRTVVAKSLKGAIVFQEAIWTKKASVESVTVRLEEDEGETSDSRSSTPSTVSSKRSAPDDKLVAGAVRAYQHRKRARHTEVDAAFAFLPSPLIGSAVSAKSRRSRLHNKKTEEESILSHLLSVDFLDGDLFEDRELEGMLRRPEEVDAFARTLDWSDDLAGSSELGKQSKPRVRMTGPKGVNDWTWAGWHNFLENVT
jgi:hypothetical protein